MSYRVVWTKRASKELLAIPKKQRLMIATWVQDNLEGCANPKAIPNSKAIQGSVQGWRYRVGSYRVLARIEEDELIIEVVRVGHRQGVYGNLPKM
ncbi:type II toxin-antitoxin system RelE/ParE family toxin [Adlercreutzia sp. ZJ473]|uniref:type II toxin-antitoxin system RelE family toxin n=1 Tax=Adlercreutzia sp. ZJ473 TaxID=2722822 RepID=UPI00155325B4|nr:type II toxin-antitoxin system RelE/ParE family toxin [Adlercreutzia sp. ZJ473]